MISPNVILFALSLIPKPDFNVVWNQPLDGPPYYYEVQTSTNLSMGFTDSIQSMTTNYETYTSLSPRLFVRVRSVKDGYSDWATVNKQ